MLTHGKSAAYKQGCRCDLCKKAASKRAKDYYNKNKDDPVFRKKYRKLHGGSSMKYRATPEGKAAHNGLVRERRLMAGALKLEKGCIKCGYNEHHAALDFHHKNGKADKVMNISRLCNYSWEKVLEEIEKCDVICSNCHRILTLGDLPRSTKLQPKGCDGSTATQPMSQ